MNYGPEEDIVMDTIYIRTIPKTINWLALTSLCLLLLKVFVLNQIAEPFRGVHELGLVFEGVLASVLASYVFYLIVVHLKQTQDRRVIDPHVTRWAQLIVGDCKSQLADFEKGSGVKMGLETLTEQQVAEAFKKIAPYSEAPLVFSLTEHANWIQYLDWTRRRSQRYVSKIMSQVIFLEARFVSLLTKIDDGAHFSIVETLSHHPIKNPDLNVFAKSFFEHCEACKALDTYLQNHVGHSTVG
jgi:hypothetical protein